MNIQAEVGDVVGRNNAYSEVQKNTLRRNSKERKPKEKVVVSQFPFVDCWL